MPPPGYHHNGFVATHALGHMMYTTVHHVPKYMSCHKAIDCGDNRQGAFS